MTKSSPLRTVWFRKQNTPFKWSILFSNEKAFDSYRIGTGCRFLFRSAHKMLTNFSRPRNAFAKRKSCDVTVTAFRSAQICAGNGTWTHKSFRSQHFKCCASTDFATPAFSLTYYFIPLWVVDACATLTSVGKTFHLSCFTYRFRHPGGFFWFRPRCVGWRLWQLGQRILRFSSRLSRWSPLMWSSSTGILPSFDISAQPHISHFGCFKPSRNNRFFNLKLWKSESFCRMDSSDCWGTKSKVRPIRQPIPVKCESSIPSFFIVCPTCW